MTRAATAINALFRRNPHAFRLAKAVSFAVVVDRALLRAARIAFVPEADAGAEADLWFSSVVTSRTIDGIVLDRDVAEALRGLMEDDEIERVWALIEKEHDWLAPSLRIEEEIAYLSVSKAPDARGKLSRKLQSVVRAMLRGDRPGLAQWASRALAMFPSSVRTLEETQMLEAGARLRLGQGVETDPKKAMPSWMSLVAPSSLPRRDLHLELREWELVLFAPEKTQSLEPAMQKIAVPDTKPIVLEVSWSADGAAQARQVVLRAGERVRLDVGADEVLVRTVAGDVFRIGETDARSPELASEVIDFSAELARHAHVVGREPELARLLAAQGIVTIDGIAGVGKTALLCELVRRLAPATPVFTHFFRSGDYRMGSISAASRSLAAQIALAYRLDASVVWLPLGGVLERLALSPRRPARLAIVLDTVDDARDYDRQFPDDPLLELLGETLPPFVTVYATSRGRLHSPAQETLHLAASIEAVAEVQGSEIAKESNGNFAKAEALAAVRSYERGGLEGVESLGASLSIDHLPHIDALGVARWLLPAEIFGDLGAAEPLLHRDGERVTLLNASLRSMVLARIADKDAAHRELLELLERHRSREDVRRYYALHAIEHLVSAGNFVGARGLCFDLTFIREVVRFYEPALMGAHVRRVLSFNSDDELLVAARVAFDREHEAMTEAPDDVEAILRAYLPASAFRESVSRLAAMDEPHATDSAPPRRHHAPVAGMAWTMNGAVSWADDGRVLFWTRRDEAPPLLVEHDTAVTCFAEGAGCFVFGDETGFLHAVHGNAKVFASVAAHAGRVSGVIGAGALPLVATWSAEGVIRLWSVVQPEGPIDAAGELLGHEEAVLACHFVGGGRLLVSASLDGTIRIWSVADRRAIHVIRNPQPVRALVVSSDGRWLAAGDAAGNLRIAAVESRGNPDIVVRTKHANGIAGIALAEDDYLAAVWGADGDGVSLWRMAIGSEWGPASSVGSVPAPPGASVAACAVLRRGLNAFVSWTNGSAFLVDLEGFEQRTLDTGGAVIRSVVERPQFFLTGDDQGRVAEWTWPQAEPTDYSKHVGRVDAIAAGRMVFVGDGEEEVYFRDSGQRMPLRLPRIISDGDIAVAWSPVDDLFVRANLASGELEELQSGRVGSACAIDSAGRIALGYRDGTIELGLGEEKTPVGMMDSEVVALKFVGPRAFLLGTARNGGLAVWDMRDGTPRFFVTARESRIVAIEGDAETEYIATIDVQGVISLRTTAAFHVISKMGSGLETRLGCRFAARDTRLVAAGRDHTIRIFDVRSGEEHVGRGHRAPITGFVVSGDQVFSCSEDRTVRMWDVHTAELLAVAYGQNAFRCIAAPAEDVLAGTDGGEVLTFRRAADLGMWAILTANEDLELAQTLSADLQRMGVRMLVFTSGTFERNTSFDALVSSATGTIAVLSASAVANEGLRQDVMAFDRTGKPVVAVVIDETDPFESESTSTLWNRVDLSDWHDPYRYDRALSALLEQMKLTRPPARATT